MVDLATLEHALASQPPTRQTSGGYSQAGVLVPIFDREGRLYCLLTQRSMEVPYHKGQIAFPGGRREESDGDLLACALREAQEEVGIDPSRVRVLGPLDDLITSSGFAVRPFVALVPRGAWRAVDPREVVRLIEAPLATLLDPENTTVRSVWDGRDLRPIFSIRHRRQEIWGASAAILVNLMRVVGLPPPAAAAVAEVPAVNEATSPYGPPPADRPLTQRAPDLATALCTWYRDHARDLPWRRTTDPYAIWVSEIMLQQTRVETVIPYYQRFLDRFPTVTDLGRASQEEVLKLWQGLGYYSRGRNLHAAAQKIVADGGRLPSTVEDWAALPGVGRSTAGAIVAITRDIPAPILDGNVRRVLTRLLALRELPAAPVAENILWHTAETLIPSDGAATYAQAIMELGATCCTPRRPDCPVCPWRRECGAHALGLAEVLPLKRPRRPLPHHEEVAVVLLRGHRVLLTRRPQRGLLAGMWGFPRDRVRTDEEPATAAHRLAQGAGNGDPRLTSLVSIDHAYSHFRITLHAYQGTANGAAPRGDADHQWVETTRLVDYAMPATDLAIAEALDAG